MKKKFIKNVLDTENEYFSGRIKYRVSSMYDVRKEDERGEWEDGDFFRDLKEKYGIGVEA